MAWTWLTLLVGCADVTSLRNEDANTGNAEEALRTLVLGPHSVMTKEQPQRRSRWRDELNIRDAEWMHGRTSFTNASATSMTGMPMQNDGLNAVIALETEASSSAENLGTEGHLHAGSSSNVTRVGRMQVELAHSDVSSASRSAIANTSQIGPAESFVSAAIRTHASLTNASGLKIEESLIDLVRANLSEYRMHGKPVSLSLLIFIESLGLGLCGIDRCLLGQYFCGLLKFLTVGGFIALWLIDWCTIDYIALTGKALALPFGSIHQLQIERPHGFLLDSIVLLQVLVGIFLKVWVVSNVLHVLCFKRDKDLPSFSSASMRSSGNMADTIHSNQADIIDDNVSDEGEEQEKRNF